jgi:hypothetical protein
MATPSFSDMLSRVGIVLLAKTTLKTEGCGPGRRTHGEISTENISRMVGPKMKRGLLLPQVNLMVYSWQVRQASKAESGFF